MMTDPANKYDSERDTRKHIALVRQYLTGCCSILLERGRVHDQSKLEEPEKSFFDEHTPLLASLDYGSEAYKQALDALRPALQHHYQVNSHHPEHYSNGVSGMTLFDVMEMLCDWKAASERHDSGSIEQSLKVNTERFSLSSQLASVLWNTAVQMGWMEEEKQTCPRRMNEAGPWEKEEGLDEWRQVGPDRTCSFCGSLHPEELEAILDRCIAGDGASIDPSTKGYKFYIRRDEVRNAGEGAIKFYIWHSPFTGEDAQRIQGKLNEAIKLSLERLRAQLNKGGGA